MPNLNTQDFNLNALFQGLRSGGDMGQILSQAWPNLATYFGGMQFPTLPAIPGLPESVPGMPTNTSTVTEEPGSSSATSSSYSSSGGGNLPMSAEDISARLSQALTMPPGGPPMPDMSALLGSPPLGVPTGPQEGAPSFEGMPPEWRQRMQGAGLRRPRRMMGMGGMPGPGFMRRPRFRGGPQGAPGGGGV